MLVSSLMLLQCRFLIFCWSQPWKEIMSWKMQKHSARFKRNTEVQRSLSASRSACSRCLGVGPFYCLDGLLFTHIIILSIISVAYVYILFILTIRPRSHSVMSDLWNNGAETCLESVSMFLSDSEADRINRVRQTQTVISYKSYCGASQILPLLISLLMASWLTGSKSSRALPLERRISLESKSL